MPPVVKKIGILGGGQLGLMLLQESANYPVETFVLDKDPGCPAAHLCHHFVQGDITHFESVYRFGKKVDALTIEIEQVNVEALEKLEEEGLRIFPRPAVLRIIKNKILQKKFYVKHQIPTAEFNIVNNREEMASLAFMLPAVNKLAEGGYDGRGVQLMHSVDDFDKVFPEPGLLEKMVDIKNEIAQIVAVNEKGETAFYPPVEMIFDPELNLLDYQLCPALIDEKTRSRVEAIAMSVARNFNSPGLFAIEMFVDQHGEVLVNETAPRVHNSGHHTIEANYCSQFDMLWRIILGYPLGNTGPVFPSAMVNIIGADGFEGDVIYEGLEDVLKIKNAFVHIYGKKQTRPGRKMGHVTLIGSDKQELIRQSHQIRSTLQPKA